MLAWVGSVLGSRVSDRGDCGLYVRELGCVEIAGDVFCKGAVFFPTQARMPHVPLKAY